MPSIGQVVVVEGDLLPSAAGASTANNNSAPQRQTAVQAAVHANTAAPVASHAAAPAAAIKAGAFAGGLLLGVTDVIVAAALLDDTTVIIHCAARCVAEWRMCHALISYLADQKCNECALGNYHRHHPLRGQVGAR